MENEVSEYEHELKVKFKGVGINSDSARISFNVDRETKFSISKADKLFGNSQVRARLSCDPNAQGDADGQQTMEGAEIFLNLTGDISGFGVRPDSYSTKIKLPKTSVDLKQLAQFANRAGTLCLSRVGDATSPATDEEGDG